MLDPSRPPLYSYEESYKSGPVSSLSDGTRNRRVRKFTDTEYNNFVETYQRTQQDPNYPAHFRIYRPQLNGVEAVFTNSKSVLQNLIRKFISPNSIQSFTNFERVNYSSTEAGRKQAAKDLALIQKMLDNGTIISYDPNNPLIATTSGGSTVYLTKAEDYSNSHYKKGDEWLVFNQDAAENALEYAEGQAAEGRTSKLFNYVMAVVIIIAIIVIIRSFKKK